MDYIDDLLKDVRSGGTTPSPETGGGDSSFDITGMIGDVRQQSLTGALDKANAAAVPPPEVTPKDGLLTKLASFGPAGVFGPRAATQTGKNLGADFGLGTTQFVEGVGSGLKWAGADTTGDYLKGVGERESQKIIDAQDTDGKVNQYGIGSSIIQSTPFTLATLPLGIGGGKLAAGAATKALSALGVGGRAADYAVGAAGLAGGTIPPSTFEAMTEAGDAYEQAVKKGASEQDAKNIGSSTFWKNMGLLGASNAAEFAVTFGNPYLRQLLPKMANQGIDKYPKAALFAGLLSNSVMEGSEEVAQENLKRGSLGALSDNQPQWNPLNFDDELKANFAAGAGTGALYGAGGHFISSRDNAPTKSDFGSQIDTFKSAITDIESGGNYDAVGPEIDGDRALGKYQIMQSNWPTWAENAGLSPDAPLTPENQEIVASNKFKEYYDEFGGDWGKVAIAWHAGPGRVNLSDDQLAKLSDGNMSTLDYRNSVLAALGNPSTAGGSVRGNTLPGISAEQIQAFNANATQEQVAALKQLATQRSEVSDNPEETAFLDKQLKRGVPGLVEIAQQYGVLDDLISTKQPTAATEQPQAQDGIIMRQTPVAQTAEAQDILDITDQSEPQAARTAPAEPNQTLEAAQAADRAALEEDASTVGALRFQATKMPTQTLLKAAKSFMQQGKEDHLNTVVNELVNRNVLPPAAKEGVLDDEMLQIAEDNVTTQALEQQAADVAARREQGQQLTDRVNALAARRFDNAEEQLNSTVQAQPSTATQPKGFTGRKIQPTAFSLGSDTNVEQPEISSPEFQPNRSIEVGTTVYHPTNGAPLEVVDASDPGMLNVKTPNGTTFNIGRKAVLLDNPKQQAPQAPQAPQEEAVAVAQPTQEPSQEAPNLDNMRTAYEGVAKELFNGQTHSRAIGLKTLQQRMKMPNAEFVNLISEIQKANIPGVELGFARNQEKAVRVSTPTGEQRYSSITFYPSEAEQSTKEPVIEETRKEPKAAEQKRVEKVEEPKAKEKPVVKKESSSNSVKDVVESKQEEKPEEEKPVAKEYPKAVSAVGDWVLSRLKDGKKFTSDELFSQADEAFGGTQAENKYTSKDAYDALELGVNRFILESEQVNPAKAATAEEASKAVDYLKEHILSIIPTQTKRTAEMDEFQQFSTPPHIAYVASWVSGVNKNDTAFEPSAGIGGIASFAKAAGAEVIANELSERRASIIKELPFDRVFTENAEQINNILPADVKPTVVIMNPPFSSTAGRVQGERKTVNATQHIEQALKRLQPGGRLVAIVGRGMSDDAKSFQSWWKKIKSEYNVRANIGIDGKDYTKYGTGFDVQILVIDKTGKTEQPTITGNVDSAGEALPILEAVRNDRASTGDRRGEQAPDKSSSKELPKESRGESGPDSGAVSVSTDRVGDKERSGGGKSGSERPAGSYRKTNVDDKTTESNEVPPSNRGRRQPDTSGTEQPESAGNTGGRSSVPSESASDTDGRIKVEQADTKAKDSELSDSTFDAYYPQKLKVPGAKKHPTALVQSAAMAAVEPPSPTYSPNLPKNLITDGTLSIAQLEAIVYAGQSFEQTLPDGTRKGYFVGDGTGLGKGREIAGVILDSLRNGKKKAVWVTKNDPLYSDAVRDWEALGGKKDQLFKLSKYKLDDSVKQADGIMFVPYGTLSSNLEVGNSGEVTTKKGKNSRLDQITEWLGKDFDGVIAFDEAHKMANSVATKGKRGVKKASAVGLSGIELQKRFPNARITYVSATGATEVGNLAYASRLGLWGEGTAFADVNDFISQIDEAGLAAMELVARDMKAMGVYIARNLSYDGVTYGTITHELNADQKEIYDTMARGWQTVLQNINKALEATGAVDAAGKVKNPNAKKNALGQFWGSQQRFFNQILTSMQMPAVVEDVRKQIKAGNAVVMQLVNTNEATQNRKIAEMDEDQPIEDLDLTPKDILLQFLDKSFPTQQFEDYKDEDGNKRSRPVVDSKGNHVENAEATAMKNNLMSKLGAMKVPDGPLEIIINTFGTKNVAEVTGRQRRVVKEKNEDSGRIEGRIERRSPSHNAADVKAFLSDKKNILVFSDAGGTGQSFHAGADMKNQRRRIHYLIQPGWRADNAVQGFGRTHRSGEVSQPHYTLVTTNLKGQKRFISTIARRLDQLGALTKGQRDAANQGLFTAKDNLESDYARDALQKFYTDMLKGQYKELPATETLTKMGLSSLLPDNNQKRESLDQNTLRDVPKFLNRLLALESDDQNKVFDRFSESLDGIIDQQIANGTLDSGMENYKALSVDVKEEKTVYIDPRSGAETKYINLEATQDNKPFTWNKMRSLNNFMGIYKNEKSGKVWAVRRGITRTDDYGRVTDTYFLQSPSANRFRTVTESDFKGDNWKKIGVDDDKAQEAWEEAVAAEPKTRKEDLHIITGAILPVWDRLPKGNAKVYRVQTSDGRRFIGRIIQEKDVDQTLRKFDTERSINYTPREIQDKIRRDNNTVTLTNGWQLSRRRVSGENRIELTGDNLWKFDDQLTKNGVFKERINWDTRYFLPIGEKFEEAFTALTKDRPVTDVAPASESQATRLNSGFDPTGGKFDDVDLSEMLTPYVNKTREAIPQLVEVGKQVILDGNTSVKSFGSKMRELLGGLWNNFKSVMNDVYQQATKAVNNENGRIRMFSNSFSKDLDAWKAGKLNPGTEVTIGNTPGILLNLGAKQLPIEISQNTIAKAVNPKGVAGGKHDLTIDLLKQLPEQINDPIMVFKSATRPEDSFVILTELKDKNGSSVIASIALDVRHSKHKANAISSVYGKNDSVKFIQAQIDEGRLLYVHNKKSQTLARTFGLQLPEIVPMNDSLSSILQQKKNNVNIKDILSNERGSVSLNLLKKKEPNPNITLNNKEEPGRINGIDRAMSSTSRLAKRYPAIKPFLNLAETAMEKQEQLRNHFKHRTQKWEKVLKQGNAKENTKKMYDILLAGDLDGKQYSDAELKEKGANGAVIKAYKMVRTAFDHAWKIANEVRQQLTTESKTMNKAGLEKLQQNKFAKILDTKQKGADEFVVTWQQPRIFETTQVISKTQLDLLKQDENVQILSEKLDSVTGYTLPEQAGYVRGDDFYEVHYQSQTPPIAHKSGYIPHFFHEWMIREKVTDENGNETYRTVGSGRTPNEALKKAEALAKDYPDAEIVIQPKTYTFPDGMSNASVMGDKDYARMTKKIAEELSINLADAKDVLGDTVKMRSKHRYLGNLFRKRTGAAGFETDLDWVIGSYFNQVSRYVALDPFKQKAMSRFERFFGDFANEDKMTETAKFIKRYIEDVNGKPTDNEKWWNDVISHSWIGKHITSYYGERVALQLSSDVQRAVAGLSLGLFNVGSAMLQLTQMINFHSKIGTKYTLSGMKAGLKPNRREKMILHRAGIDSSLSIETNGYSRNPSGKGPGGAGIVSKAASTALQGLDLSTQPFRAMDVWLRRAAALGAYQKAVDEGKTREDALMYATEINKETNFEYGVHDTPEFIRQGGPLRQLLFQFKKYPIKQLELMGDIVSNGGFAENMRFWLPFLAISGIWGVPGVGVIFSILKGLFDFDPEEKMKKAALEWAGKDKAKLAIVQLPLYGALAPIAGVDVSKRAGIGDAIPTTVLDLLGPTVGKTTQFATALGQGNTIAALKAFSPGLGNFAQAYAGEVTGKRDRVKTVYDTAGERLARGLGFVPIDEALERDTKRIIRAEENERSAKVTGAIDAYIKNPSKENSEKLQELKISAKRVRQEAQKKGKTDLERTLQGVSKKRRSDYDDLTDAND